MIADDAFVTCLGGAGVGDVDDIGDVGDVGDVDVENDGDDFEGSFFV